jgi:hypothetical protein
MPNRHTTFLLVNLFLATTGCRTEDVPRPPSVAALVDRLGSDSFTEREEATRQLSALELLEVPPEVSRALESVDPEVRRRAASVVAAIKNRIVQRSIAPVRDFARRGEVSRVVAATAKWEQLAADAPVWDAPFDVLQQIRLRAKEIDRTVIGPEGSADLRAYLATSKPELIRTAGRYPSNGKAAPDRSTGGQRRCVMAADCEFPDRLENSICVARGDVTVARSMKFSVVLANGSVVMNSDAAFSLVVSDGDVEVRGGLYHCVVISRGTIQLSSAVRDSQVYAGSDITVGLLTGPGQVLSHAIKANESNPLEFVKFFELSRVGVEVTEADKVVRVKAVADATAFAAAGAKVGDVVEGVNGTKPDSAEALRRLLRDALAVGDATVTVRRGDAAHTLKVTLPE